jgi:hypothetical protein
LFLSTGIGAQTGATGGEWRTYGGDLASTHYAPLTQINKTTSTRSRLRGASRPIVGSAA